MPLGAGVGTIDDAVELPAATALSLLTSLKLQPSRARRRVAFALGRKEVWSRPLENSGTWWPQTHGERPPQKQRSRSPSCRAAWVAFAFDAIASRLVFKNLGAKGQGWLGFNPTAALKWRFRRGE